MKIKDTHLRAAFHGIEPGWYRSADLLPRFNAWAKEAGKEEVSVKTLGEAISKELACRVKKRGHASVWWIDEPTLTHRNWFQE